MNLNAQDYLAKLLAKENLTVQHGNYSTASFNVVDRILNLPLWADKGKVLAMKLVMPYIPQLMAGTILRKKSQEFLELISILSKIFVLRRRSNELTLASLVHSR